MTVSGTGLDQDGMDFKCVFGQAEARAERLNASATTCVVPGALSAGAVAAGLSGVGDILSISGQYHYYEDPVIRSILPRYGAIGRSSLVTLVGSGFVGAGLECRFGTEVISGRRVRLLSASLMVCESPPSQEAGGVAVAAFIFL